MRRCGPTEAGRRWREHLSSDEQDEEDLHGAAVRHGHVDQQRMPWRYKQVVAASRTRCPTCAPAAPHMLGTHHETQEDGKDLHNEEPAGQSRQTWATVSLPLSRTFHIVKCNQPASRCCWLPQHRPANPHAPPFHVPCTHRLLLMAERYLSSCAWPASTLASVSSTFSSIRIVISPCSGRQGRRGPRWADRGQCSTPAQC